jgi:hypothetical protein
LIEALKSKRMNAMPALLKFLVLIAIFLLVQMLIQAQPLLLEIRFRKISDFNLLNQ